MGAKAKATISLNRDSAPEVIVTEKEQTFVDNNVKRSVAINVKGFLDPNITFGKDDSISVKIPEILLRFETIISPPLPSEMVRMTEPNEDLKIKTPGMDNVL